MMKQTTNQQLQQKLPNSQQEAIQRLRQIMNRLSVKTEDMQRIQKAGLVEALEHMPLDELQDIVDNLRTNLEKSVRFVSDQEVELAAQNQAIADLEEKLQAAGEYERFSLEVELANEQERKDLLEATLIGQRRNLRKQEATYNQYWRVLRRRQGALEADPYTQQVALVEPVLAPPQAPETEIESEESIDSAKQRSPQKLALAIAGLLTLSIALLYGLRATRQPNPTTAPTASLGQKTIATNAVAALGYIEPKGEVIKLSAPTMQEGARVAQLLVNRGDKVKAGQIIAILDSRDRLQAALEQAKTNVRISQANLAKVKAGAKSGDIQAQDARFLRTQAELQGQIAAQKATISSLEGQLSGNRAAQEANIAKIRAELRDADGNCDRYQKLFAEGGIAEQERNRVCLQAETTRSSLKAAEADLRRIVSTLQEQINEAKATLNKTVATLQRQIEEDQAMLSAVSEVRPVDVRVAQAELLSAQAAVKRAQADLDRAYVRAPSNGQILKIHAWPGEIVSNDGILELGQTDQMYVTAEVYETDIARVRVGQTATIKSHGIVGDLRGTVDEVGLQIGQKDVLGTDPVADVDARVVDVKIRINPEDNLKIANLTNLQVNVIINTNDRAEIIK
ncbi:ABC exporter membrane fusion protein, DevB family [Pleurocapsa sp. PCC 7327]|uniref:HlyD family efflux transporter periplasmic adaptor subunit n=1 Tax=Pleurocapsa sp. PCC 7327 TaxID=118163 RepID=UPI00029FC187|nr:HlyD family efflux transporter periplasmic adaptor subunit [Pleurocapsa sp. PCC 7327]AFY76494.1 ABC exporter membrane fusion protein, DevB family [Pleurocapsa sp. PCC 7327]